MEEVELSLSRKLSTATISEADTGSSDEILEDSPFTLTDGEISAKL